MVLTNDDLPNGNARRIGFDFIDGLFEFAKYSCCRHSVHLRIDGPKV